MEAASLAMSTYANLGERPFSTEGAVVKEAVRPQLEVLALSKTKNGEVIKNPPRYFVGRVTR